MIFTLNWRDFAKGLVMAVLAAVLFFLEDAIKSGSAIDWNLVLRVAYSTGLTYLLKNYFTDQQGKLFGKL